MHSPTLLPLFDTHCHLDLPELALELPRYCQAAVAAGVRRLLVPAVTPERWSVQQDLLHYIEQLQLPLTIHLAYGVHPWWWQDANKADLDRLETLLAAPNSALVAVGECGLDFALQWLDEDRKRDHQQQQLALLDAQVALAARYHKPLVLHHRQSQAQLLQLLKARRFSQGGILHAFSGSQAQAHAFLDLGFKLGIGGTISYERASKTRHTVSRLPLSSLVLETDAPSMPLAGHQGQPNHPAMAREVFRLLCGLRSEPAEDIAAQLWRNSEAALQLGA